MHSLYPHSTKNIWLRGWKQILASTFFMWSLLEMNLTVEGNNHRCPKQKAGDGKTKHTWQAVCLTFFLNPTCEQKPSKALTSISPCKLHQDAFTSSPFKEQPSRIANVCSLFRSVYLFWHRRRWTITKMMALESFLSRYSPIQVPGQTVNK